MNESGKSGATGAFVAVTTLFFAWGLITSLVDPLVAAVKGIFHLSDVEAQLSASAFFIAYGLFSFPAAAFLSRIKAVSAILLALGLMLCGCLIMLSATNFDVYEGVLLGLFLLASGITLLQVTANPLAAALGRPETSHLRLTVSQTFNSFGTFIGPYLGATLFLRGVEVKAGSALTEQVRAAALGGIDVAFLWIAALIVLLGGFLWFSRRLIAAAAPAQSPAKHGVGGLIGEALSSRWAVIGGLAIFLYVGAEVSIGTQMALLLNSDSIWALPLEDAGKLVSLYWGGAMVGRFIGSLLLTRVKATTLLMTNTAVAAMLCLVVATVGGVPAGYAALAIGLFNSVMFPLIFTVALERSSASAEATSGLLCFSIVGGAVLPPLAGLISQSTSYSTAYALPALCYAALAGFAYAASRVGAVRQAGAAAGH